VTDVDTGVATEVAAAPEGRKIRANEEPFLFIQEFLTDEADLLDNDHYVEWVETMLTDDVHYRMPLRESRYRFDGDGFVPDGVGYFNHDRQNLHMLARHNIEFKYAYERDPAPRIRRFVTNLKVREGENPGEYVAKSSLLVTRNRFDQAYYDLLTAERVDVIRETPDGMKLALRDIYVDMEVLSTYFWDGVLL
jgi:3-phenylpropionate/cinnamic acid dioxygenase small subunit